MNIMFFLKPKSDLAYIYDYHFATGFGDYGISQVFLCTDIK